MSPARKALLELYQDVDQALDNLTCAASTECCRFELTGREPLITPLEVAEMTLAARASGGKLGAKVPRSRRLAVAQDGACVFLGSQGRCTIYNARPLGCRTFFCERIRYRDIPDSEPGTRLARDLSRPFVARLTELAEQHSPRDPRPRPLTHVFGRDA